MIFVTHNGSQDVSVHSPNVTLKVRTLLEGLRAETANVLRHFSALFAKMTIEGALVRIRPRALVARIRFRYGATRVPRAGSRPTCKQNRKRSSQSIPHEFTDPN